ncbi:hypothetical protein JOQ06_012202 [Pogonophryne albipinna]|uniref:Uncharacterized protein n=1 Tax=Pogonophryne albipinna TaxID=1090488 RepID=A0AAD6FQJ7_9TELE|nr:hypothetical protein JOQ06_012202 [Pogonophryne albipinna]
MVNSQRSASKTHHGASRLYKALMSSMQCRHIVVDSASPSNGSLQSPQSNAAIGNTTPSNRRSDPACFSCLAAKRIVIICKLSSSSFVPRLHTDMSSVLLLSSAYPPPTLPTTTPTPLFLSSSSLGDMEKGGGGEG